MVQCCSLPQDKFPLFRAKLPIHTLVMRSEFSWAKQGISARPRAEFSPLMQEFLPPAGGARKLVRWIERKANGVAGQHHGNPMPSVPFAALERESDQFRGRLEPKLLLEARA